MIILSRIKKKLLSALLILVFSSSVAYAAFPSSDPGAVLSGYINNQYQRMSEQYLMEAFQPNYDDGRIINIETRAVAITPKDRQAIKKIYFSYQNQQYQEVVDLANSLLRNNRYWGEVYLYRGIGYFFLKDYKRALKDAKRFLEFNPGNVKGLLLSSGSNLMLNKYSNAIKDCEKAIKYEDNEKAYSLCGFAYAISEKDLNKARDYSNKAVDINASSNIAHLLRGFLAVKDKNIKNSLLQSNDLLQKNSDNPFAYLMRAYSKYLSGEYSQAMVDIQKSQQVDKNNPYAYFLLGVIYSKTGEDSKAKDNLRKTRELLIQSNESERLKRLEGYLLDEDIQL